MGKNHNKINITASLFLMCSFFSISYAQTSNSSPYLTVNFDPKFTAYQLRTVDAGQDQTKIDHFHKCISQDDTDFNTNQDFPQSQDLTCWDVYENIQMPSDLRIDVYVKKANEPIAHPLCTIDSVNFDKATHYTLNLKNQPSSFPSSCKLE